MWFKEMHKSTVSLCMVILTIVIIMLTILVNWLKIIENCSGYASQKRLGRLRC